MTYLVAAFFFTLALLTAAVALHMTILQNWNEILLALRGELGLTPRPSHAREAEQVNGFGHAAS